jgi:hypothetical protein
MWMWILQWLLFAVFAFLIAIFVHIMFRKWFAPTPCPKCCERERKERLDAALQHPPQSDANTQLPRSMPPLVSMPQLAEESDIE